MCVMKRILGCFFILLGFSSYAQNASVYGIITLEGGALGKAQVTLNDGEYNTETALDGTYRLANIKPGTYTLLVISPISEKKEQVIRLVKDQGLELILDVKPIVTELDEIAIVSRSLGLTDRTPYNVTKLEVRDVSFKGSPSGIMGQLQNEPGVNAAEMGHGIVKPFIRGLGFSRVATIYQGNKFENHQWGADHGLGLNDLEIESVDVIKGPSSILYGSGALGGVIIMNDDQSYLNDSVFHATFGTTYNSVSNGVRAYGSFGKQFSNKWYVAGSAARESHADYYDGDNRLIGNSRFNSMTARVHTGYAGKRFTNKLSYSYNQQLLGIIDDDEMEEGESLATTRNDREMQLPFQEVTDHLISYNQQFNPNNHWKTNASVSYHLNYRKEIEDDIDDIDLGLTQHHVFYNLRAEQSKHENFTNTIGVQGSVVDMKNMLEAEEILIPNAFYNEVGLYYLNTYKKKAHTIQGGLRMDYRSLVATADQENIVEEGYVLPGEPDDRSLGVDFLGLTGSLGYTYQINPRNLVKINASSGFRSPDIAEILSNGPHPGTNRYEMGNVGFGREQSLQGDASWVRRSNNWDVQLSAFTNYVNNYIYFMDSGDTTDTGLNIWEFRQTDALLYGGEIAVNYKPFSTNKLMLNVHANLIRGNDINNNENLTFIPADRTGIKVNYQPLKTTALSVFAQYDHVFEQNRPGDGEQRTTGYNLVQAGIKYEAKFNNKFFTIGVTGFNLLNETYIDHISILRAFNVTNPGRNIMVNLQFRF